MATLKRYQRKYAGLESLHFFWPNILEAGSQSAGDKDGFAGGHIVERNSYADLGFTLESGYHGPGVG